MSGKALLFVSPFVIAELRDVTSRPRVVRKLRLTPDRVAEFIETVMIIGTLLNGVAEVFSYARDPKDAHYVNLALAADARLIVSRDRDLLSLMQSESVDGVGLLKRFPDFRVLTPVDFLNTLEPDL